MNRHMEILMDLLTNNREARRWSNRELHMHVTGLLLERQPSEVSRWLAKLQQMGLIRRTWDENHQRIILVIANLPELDD